MDPIANYGPPQMPTADELSGNKKTKDPSSLGQDAFLKLLVAQLKYQDPMNPADNTEFISQTAQFSMLEQLTQMSKQSDLVLASQQTQSASSLVGKSITWLDKATVQDMTGTVSGAVFGGKDGPVLKVGDMEVPFSAIKEVAAAPASAG